MNKTLALFIITIISLVSCTDNDITVLDEKEFSLTLNDKWEKGYYKDSVILKKSDEQILFQTNVHRATLNESGIKDTLLKLIDVYRQTEMQKSKEVEIGENHYGDMKGVFVVRFIGHEKNERYFTVFLFGTPDFVLSVYFEKTNTVESRFEARAGEIINRIVLKQ